jgi:hypothetical protein
MPLVPPSMFGAVTQVDVGLPLAQVEGTGRPAVMLELLNVRKGISWHWPRTHEEKIADDRPRALTRVVCPVVCPHALCPQGFLRGPGRHQSPSAIRFAQTIESSRAWNRVIGEVSPHLSPRGFLLSLVPHQSSSVFPNHPTTACSWRPSRLDSIGLSL